MNYLIKNGTVHVGDGRVLVNCDILTEGTLIKKVGRNIAAADAVVIDASNMEVFPGFIDPVCTIGAWGIPTRYLDHNEATDPVTPEMNIKYSIDPDETTAQEFYKSGITTVGFAPGNVNLIGGQMAVCKTVPMKMSQRIIKEQAGLKCSVTSRVKHHYGGNGSLPMTKMGIFQLFSESLRKARAASEEERTRGQQVLCEVFDEQKMPVFVAASSKNEMDGILHLLKEEKVKINLVDAFSFADSVEEIKQANAGIILGNINAYSQLAKNKMDLTRLSELIAHGNLIAFSTTNDGMSEGREVFIWNAIEVYRAGIDAEEIIKMMTSNPAKMLGVEGRVGTLEEGKDADISIYSAHPVKSYAARVVHSLVNGEVIC